VLSSPTLDTQGFVYAGSQSEQIYKLSTDDGSEQWSKATGRRAPLLTAPTLSDNGKLYAGANGLISISADGTVEDLSNLDILTSPLLVDGAVYTTTESGYFVRLDLDLGSLADSAWPIQHGNSQRTGYLSP
jgi:outer membrane protein assembly factor BamB